MMKKVIVTGATGFIGRALTEKLLENGVKVYGIGRNPKRLKNFNDTNFIPVVLDFEKYSEIGKVIDDREFDVCFHTAWSVSDGKGYLSNFYDQELQNYNMRASCDLAEHMSELGVKKFVFCGSSYEAMYKAGYDFPVNYYGIVKKSTAELCRAICLKNGVDFCKAVLTNTFGIGDVSKKAVNSFILKMIANDEIKLIDGHRSNDWVYIDDTVNGMIAAAGSPYKYKDYYVGHEEITDFRFKISEMKKILNSTSILKFGEYSDDTYVDYSRFDLSGLKKDTGFECVIVYNESILKTADWLKNKFTGELK